MTKTTAATYRAAHSPQLQAMAHHYRQRRTLAWQALVQAALEQPAPTKDLKAALDLIATAHPRLFGNSAYLEVKSVVAPK